MEIEESNSNNPVNGINETNKNANKASREGISKGALTTIMIIIFLVVGLVFYSLYNREHKQLLSLMDLQKKSLTEKITDRDSVISEWISTFDQIEKNIALIKEKEKIITVSSKDVEFSKDKKEQVLEDIKYINSLLDQNKKKIASLNARLKKSGGTIKILQNKISELEASMKQSEDEISDLKTSLTAKDFKIEQLNVQMADMQTTIEKKDEKIVTQTNELNKAFFTSGTFKELKERGLVTKEGGFIGLGKKKSLLDNFSDSSFKQIDITETKTIPVNSKEAKLITEHPTGSYEFIRGTNNRIKDIEIKDPKEFWKISKYAVVELIK
jgi:hypothetical protein